MNLSRRVSVYNLPRFSVVLPRKASFYVGLLLLSMVVLQMIAPLPWRWLRTQQQNDTYRLVSGLALAILITAQWGLTLARMMAWRTRVIYRWHQWLGAIAPVFFYLHSMVLGYAYLGLMSGVYLVNVALGLFNPGVVGAKHRHYTYGWMVAHVSLSCLVVGLGIYHTYIVFLFE